MHIQLDIGWLKHPFPVSSFRVTNDEQIKVLRSLGLSAVRCLPAKSHPDALNALNAPNVAEALGADEVRSAGGEERVHHGRRQQGDGLWRKDLLVGSLPDAQAHGAHEKVMLQACDQQFVAAADGYLEVIRQLVDSPLDAMKTSSNLVQGYVTDLLEASSTTIRLLSESAGEQQGAHPINVTVLSLLLGKAYGLNSARLLDLGLAALLHDIGKIDIDPRCTEMLPGFSPQQKANYEEHVGASVAYGQRMGLGPGALTAIAQHHEARDGSGFPLHLLEEDLSVEGQILALTNCYDKLCNPLAQAVPLTPHEALSSLFAQRSGGFARSVVELFVRVMGVYPPGSVIQLSDERFGLVVSVHGAHPLKPVVLLYSDQVVREEAVFTELSELPGVVIKRSLRSAQLPRDVLDYLSPRKRVCYFFERAVPLAFQAGDA